MQLEVYEIGVDRFKIVEMAFGKHYKVFTVNGTKSLYEILKEYSLCARSDNKKPPLVRFYI